MQLAVAVIAVCKLQAVGKRDALHWVQYSRGYPFIDIALLKLVATGTDPLVTKYRTPVPLLLIGPFGARTL